MDLTGEFERHRAYLHAVARRVLGSAADAEDAVQEAWLRLQRTDTAAVADLRAWLTTVVARVALNQLRARRREVLPERLPEPEVRRDDPADPEGAAELADSVGLALLVVLDALEPDERLAFVLHDLFALPFADIAPLVDRTPAAARQLASRARRRVREAGPATAGAVPDGHAAGASREAGSSRATGRRVADAFLAAARGGDLEALVAVLDPDVVLRAETPDELRVLRGADAVARSAASYRAEGLRTIDVLVDGTPAALRLDGDRPVALLAFTVTDGRITELDVWADPERLAGLVAGLT